MVDDLWRCDIRPPTLFSGANAQARCFHTSHHTSPISLREILRVCSNGKLPRKGCVTEEMGTFGSSNELKLAEYYESIYSVY